MISISNNSMKQTLHQYLFQYRSAFNKQIYLLFTGCFRHSSVLKKSGTRSFFAITSSGSTAIRCTSFYYFLSYSKFSLDALLITTVKISLSLIPSEMKYYATLQYIWLLPILSKTSLVKSLFIIANFLTTPTRTEPLTWIDIVSYPWQLICLFL